MPGSRTLNRLTDKAVKAYIGNRLAGRPVPKKLQDGGGLHLTVTDAGSALWRVKYQFAGTEKLASLGAYPDVSLGQARVGRAQLTAQLRNGQNPSAEKRKAKAASAFASDNTFGAVATSWLERQRPGWSNIHYAKSRRALERDVLPTLGRLPIADVSAGMIAAVIQGVIARGVTETASRVLEHIGAVFELAQALDLRPDNPAAPVRQLLPKRKPVKQHAALLEIQALRDILRGADAANISPAVRLCNRLLAFTAVRPGNAVSAAWAHFQLDEEAPRWVIPRERMKVKDRPFPHTVYLGRSITAELRAWRETIGSAGYLFLSPSGTRGHISVEGLDRVYSRTLNLGGKHSPHGWRASFRTLAVESGGFPREIGELALDHVADSATVRAYDRGLRLEERKRLAEWWDDQLTMKP